MGDLRALIHLMRALEEQLTACMRCGMCQAVCPLYAQTGREADVARGKLALLDGLLKQMLDNPEQVSERLQKCLLCGSCEANCPSGVHVMEIFIRARAILAGFIGLSPAQKLIFKGMLAHPELMDKIVRLGSKFQPLFSRPVNDLLGTSCSRIGGSSLLGGRHFKPLAAEAFQQRTPSLNSAAGRSGIKVAFFVGCLIDKIFPEVANAVVALCERLGVGLFIPPNQGCCGIPAVSAGDTDTFLSLLRHNLHLLDQEPFDYLVTACATCTSTIRKIWPMLVPPQEAGLGRAAARLAEKTLDISQFLVDRGIAQQAQPAMKSKTANPPVAVTYHDPCHLKKSLGVSDQPRALLRLAGYALKELRPGDQCCGMGGSFNLKHYPISRQIGLLKRDAIKETGAAVVATSCPACMLQISDMLSQAGDRIAVKHVIELFATGFL